LVGNESGMIVSKVLSSFRIPEPTSDLIRSVFAFIALTSSSTMFAIRPIQGVTGIKNVKDDILIFVLFAGTMQ